MPKYTLYGTYVWQGETYRWGFVPDDNLSSPQEAVEWMRVNNWDEMERRDGVHDVRYVCIVEGDLHGRNTLKHQTLLHELAWKK